MTLTELSFYSRKTLPFIILAGVLFLIIFILFVFAMRSPLLREGNKEVGGLNPVFGALPRPVFSHKINYPIGGTFTLDNIEGKPITATSSAQVFFIPPKSTKFSYIQTIYSMAKNAGFDTEKNAHVLNDTTATFDDGRQKLDIDITYFNFSYKYAYENSPLTFINPQLMDEATIKDRAVSYLQQLGRYPAELSHGSQHIVYMRYNPVTQDLEVVQNPSQANVVEVDFFRPDIDGSPNNYPAVSAKYFTSQNYVVMTLNPVAPKVLKAQIQFFDKDNEHVGIYPLKSGDDAWAEFNSGNGTIVSPGGTSYPIVIKKMFLGYFEPDTYQPYLQPVYVFLGDNNFAAYVPAVKN